MQNLCMAAFYWGYINHWIDAFRIISSCVTPTHSCTSVIMLINPKWLAESESGRDDQTPLHRCSILAQLVFSWPPKVPRSVLIIHPASLNQQRSEQRSSIRPDVASRHRWWRWRGRDGIISRMFHHSPQYGAHLISLRTNSVRSLGIDHL